MARSLAASSALPNRMPSLEPGPATSAGGIDWARVGAGGLMMITGGVVIGCGAILVTFGAAEIASLTRSDLTRSAWGWSRELLGSEQWSSVHG
jgi:hypothetical protein